MENQTASVSVDIRPHDHRCRYWAKIIRAGEPLPEPRDVNGARDLPASYLRKGQEELLPGDSLFEGEENYPRCSVGSIKWRRKLHGWTYSVAWCDAEGNLHRIAPNKETKALLKAQGMTPDLLMGSGGVAACVRAAHGVRMGMEVK